MLKIKESDLVQGTSSKLQEAREYVSEHKEAVIQLKERHRFHHMPEVGWMNDPNGFSTFKGEYHLFYQYYPYDVAWGPMHWGHVKSRDLIKWEYLPVALAPDQSYESGGCFSGSALEVDGKHVLMYTGHTNPDPSDESKVRQVQCLAIGDGVNYKKYKYNPIIKTEEMPEGSSLTDFRDPKVWKKGEFYYCVIGSKTIDNSARVLLYRSNDLVHWDYVGVIGESHHQFGYMWECPDIFELDGKDVLIMSPQGVKPDEFRHHNTNTTVYAIGELNEQTAQFSHGEMEELDFGLDFYAPQTTESLDGRRLMIAWMQSWHRLIPTDRYGWVTSMTIPRELTIKDGILYQWPVREMESYRQNECHYESICINQPTRLEGVNGRWLDLELTVDLNEATTFEMKVMKDDIHETIIHYDKTRQVLSFDRTLSRSGIDGLNRREMPLPLINETLSLRLLMDTYSVELFAQDGMRTMTSTVYSDLSADGIEFLATGNAYLTISKWDLEV